MKKLTGKAKDHCKKWLLTNGYQLPISQADLHAICTNSLIIEWLDSVGIYIGVCATESEEEGLLYDYEVQESNTLNSKNGRLYFSRRGATEAAISEAVEIFNRSK